MRKLIGILLIIGVAVFVSGCIQTKQDFTLNSDGSGKVVVETILIMIPMDEEAMKDAVRKVLEESSGVVAWKDVAFKRTDDGNVSFKGTAYFRDISKLKLELVDMKIKPFFTKAVRGNIVLELRAEEEDNDKKEEKAMVAELSEKEIAEKIEMERMRWESMKLMMGTVVPMKIEISFHLPGTLKEVTNLKRDKTGVLRITHADLLEIMDELIADDALLREMIITGGDDFMKDFMAGKLSGAKVQIRATVTGDLKPLFNYNVEVAAARKNYPKLLKELGLVAAIPVEPIKGRGFKSLRIGEVQRTPDSLSLSLVGELAGTVMDVTGGKLEKAIADNGDNLLLESEQDREIMGHRMDIKYDKKKDTTTVVFKVNLSPPRGNVKSLNEVSGTLEYVGSAEGSREVDLGIEDFKTGAKGKKFEAVISVEESVKDRQNLELRLKLSIDRVKSVIFYDADGVELDVSGRGFRYDGRITTFYYEGKFPQKGRIVVVEVFDKLEKFKIPFKIGNVSLPRAIEPLIAALKDKDWSVRRAAAEALGEIGDPRAVEPLIVVLKDGAWGVRKGAAEALRKIIEKNFGEDPEKWQEWWEENKEAFLKGR